MNNNNNNNNNNNIESTRTRKGRRSNKRTIEEVQAPNEQDAVLASAGEATPPRSLDSPSRVENDLPPARATPSSLGAITPRGEAASSGQPGEDVREALQAAVSRGLAPELAGEVLEIWRRAREDRLPPPGSSMVDDGGSSSEDEGTLMSGDRQGEARSLAEYFPFLAATMAGEENSKAKPAALQSLTLKAPRWEGPIVVET
jgi:hypothetical protein